MQSLTGGSFLPGGRTRRQLCAGLLAVLALTGPALSVGNRNALLYFEAQAVTAWDFSRSSLDLFSLSPHHPMQKPGLGLDSVLRFSRRKVDLGYVAFQARAVYDQKGERPLDLQVYNAYVRVKTGVADVWAGHNKPAFGLAYALDNHALLLPDATMLDVGFDRDWGLGAHRDFPRGDAALSLTTGSGMALKLRGNYLVSIRVSRGVAVRDNYSLGLSLGAGRVLSSMDGVGEAPREPVAWRSVSIDGTYFWRNLESRLELITAKRAGSAEHLLLLRQGINLLEEARLKLEAQAAFRRTADRWTYLAAGGVTYRMGPDLTFRAMVLHDHGLPGTRLALQLYYYGAL
jgi:hypothetical protein